MTFTVRTLPFVALAFLATACGSSSTPNLAKPALAATDSAFIMGAGQASNAEIAAANLALTRSTSADVLAFANLMITDHTAENSALAQVGTDVGEAAPTGVNATQAATAATLTPLGGAAFDKAYIDSEISGHAMNLQNNYAPELASGTNAEVKQYATTYQPQVQSHLTKADAIQARDGF